MQFVAALDIIKILDICVLDGGIFNLKYLVYDRCFTKFYILLI